MASIARPKAKSASASVGLCPPDTLTRGSAPGPRYIFSTHTTIK